MDNNYYLLFTQYNSTDFDGRRSNSKYLFKAFIKPNLENLKHPSLFYTKVEETVEKNILERIKSLLVCINMFIPIDYVLQMILLLIKSKKMRAELP